jgi:pyruvate formate lyase activating enzyme
MLSAIITDIQRFSVHDGPGIRTLVFFKGCPLKCIWCQNPETLSSSPQLFYSESICIHCGLCAEECPRKAIRRTPDGVVFERSLCQACGRCVPYCYPGARRMVNREVSLEEVFAEVMKDEVFYRNSGGGVTLSGGEVSLYPSFARELLKKLKGEAVHTAIETCGYAEWPSLRMILEYSDLALFDIKLTDRVKHERYTGVDNQKILDNLARVARLGVPLIVRIPLIPGVNNDARTLREIAHLAQQAKAAEVHILPFHQLGASKWLALGRAYQCAQMPCPSHDEIEEARRILGEGGLKVNVGGAGGA